VIGSVEFGYDYSDYGYGYGYGYGYANATLFLYSCQPYELRATSYELRATRSLFCKVSLGLYCIVKLWLGWSWISSMRDSSVGAYSEEPRTHSRRKPLYVLFTSLFLYCSGPLFKLQHNQRGKVILSSSLLATWLPTVSAADFLKLAFENVGLTVLGTPCLVFYHQGGPRLFTIVKDYHESHHHLVGLSWPYFVQYE
jgi:hypothetical protein